MIKTLFNLGLLAFIIVSLFSCDNNEKNALIIPSSYDESTYVANTELEQTLLTNLTNLTSEAKKGRVNGVVVSSATLTDLFGQGTPSLKSSISSYYGAKLEGANGWMSELSKASGNTYVPATPTIGDEGGTYGGFLFSENGVEKEQLIEKGQFGATLYYRAVDLITNSSRAPELSDKLIKLLGANPTFPNSNSANVASPDKFLASYAARRDKNDGNGMYTSMKAGFIKLQAALKAGSDYRKEQDEAITVIEENWEKANAATMINYCHSVVFKLSSTSPTEADLASSLHSLAECIGFIHGWKTISQNHKIITDAQIDEVLVLFNAPAEGTATVYKFVTERETELAKISQVITKLKNIYGFSDQQIEDFKKNWVAEQGR